MTAMVLLLRAVNVGARTKLPMADLRRIAEGCGFEQVRTYIQSGNLVCSTPEASRAAATLKEALARETEVKPDVIGRTRDELAAVVDANPYLARGEDPSHLHVAFLAAPGGASLASLDLDAYRPEEVAAIGRELYLFMPNGLGRSKLAGSLSRLAGPSGTTRNWRTVTKLLAMADEIA